LKSLLISVRFTSSSSICETNGFLVKSASLTGITPTLGTTLKDPSQAEGLYEILSGTALNVIISALEKDGRAVMNLGGFKGMFSIVPPFLSSPRVGGQGIVGATATGTHGSGLTLPPLASMIRGLLLVSAQFDNNGQPVQYHIEPTDGITDPQKHTGPAKLVQDDATFNALATGLGAFGVVYSVTLATVPFYWITETRQKTDWPSARKLLQQGPEGDILKHHNAEVWINPYTAETLITRRDVVASPPDASKMAGANENPFFILMRDLPALRKIAADIQGGDIANELSAEAGVVLAAFLKNFPLIVPTVSATKNRRLESLADHNGVLVLRLSILLSIHNITRNRRQQNIMTFMTLVSPIHLTACFIYLTCG
jgi:hypothetical protein